MAKVASLGHTTLDIIFFMSEGHLHELHGDKVELCVPFPTKISVERRELSLGGNAANVGAGLIKIGHTVSLVSRVGEDGLGSVLSDLVDKVGFDTQFVQTSSRSDTSVILNYGGDRTILSYHDDQIYSFPSNLEDVEWVYLSSLGFNDRQEFYQRLFEWKDQHPQVGMVFNPDREEIKSGCAGLSEIFSHLHTIILNRSEAEDMLNCDKHQTGDNNDVRFLLQAFLDHGVPRVVITDGKEGVYFASTDVEPCHLPTIEIEVVDATGAGDAFSSGYLGALAHGKAPTEAVRCGVAQSSHVITQPGAVQGLLGMDELEGRLKNHPEVSFSEL